MTSDIRPNPAARPDMSPPETTVTVIEPARGWMAIDFRELWQYRELFGFLVWRDVKVRYKQTVLGFAWAVIVPLVQMVVFTLIFGARGAGIPTDGLPPMIYFMMNLVIWRLFQLVVVQTGGSLVNNSNLLTKIYFPRLIIPAASMLKAFVDFIIAFAMLLILMACQFSGGKWTPFWPPASGILVMAPILLTLMTGLGVGLVFATLNVRYRDITEITPLLLQVWMFASTIMPFSKFMTAWDGHWAYIYALNPIGSAIEAFRWTLASQHVTAPADSVWWLMAISTPISLAAFLVGVLYFKRLERRFADVI